MSEHTPGPWEYTGHRPTVEASVNGSKQTIATLLTLVRWEDDKAGYIDTRPERDANARLIASAPDMAAELARLRAALERIAKPDEIARDPSNFGSFPEQYQKFAQEIARSTLSKMQTETAPAVKTA